MNSHLTRNVSCVAVFLATLLTAIASADAFDETEKELLAVLRSDAPEPDKAIACKKLAIHGSAQAVPELAKLLPNPRLSSWSRIALEAIPGDAADEALRQAADSVEGRLLVGVINSIGVRRDAKAVATLTGKIQDTDSEVAAAAAVALGHIGDSAALKSLRAALASSRTKKIRSAAAEGLVLCAERLTAAGDLAAAIDVYDAVRKSELPTQRIIEATRGAILARKQEGIPLLIESLQSEDKKFFQLALSVVREFPGGEIDKALAAELDRTTSARAALLVQAMSDRPDTVVLAAVLKAAEAGDKPVRMSAIDALARIGDDSCLATLLTIAANKDAEMAQLARETLAGLSGQKVDDKIVALLTTARGDTYTLLLQLVGQRRIEAVPTVLKALDHDDDVVRRAALVALGETVSLKQMDVLISQVIAPSRPEDAETARQALRVASVRMPDREACAAQLTAAFNRAPAATKSAVLEILSEVGGAKALQTLAATAKSDDPQLQDTSSRLLGKWNSLAAAPVLLDLAKTGPAEKYRVRALRGYLGLARKFPMPESQRAQMCQNAFDTTRRPAEHKLALDVLKLHASPAGLKVAVDAIKIPGLKADATAAALAIARKVGGRGANVRKLLAAVGLGKVKLEIVKARYGAGSTQKDVTDLLRKHASDLPLISLPSASYNASFGDPTPGVNKRLTIQYRIDGKLGDASFGENELIILPIPK